jgi:acyl-CoA synthetase (AMP-forming)/AMP-acid ligase II
MTEASPATHSTAPTLSYGKIGTVGICVPNTECIVADLETGEPLEAWKEGELWVRGPQVMRGYLNQPEATRRTLDQDGWLHTGDIGYADSDGDFHIVDRLKELIKYKGFQIAPAELEALLLAHPCVADAAVVPMPDAIAGEVPKAFVVLRSPASSVDLAAHVAEHVAPYKRLRAIEFVDAIPKSASGKILRRVLRDAETQRARDAMTAGR